MEQDVIECLPHLESKGRCLNEMVQHKLYLDKHNKDKPEIPSWKYSES